LKRIGNLYDKIISIENLELADKRAQKGKHKQKSVIKHNKNREENILKLHNLLKNKQYKTSDYHLFNLYEPKKREISSLPYYPDRIVHHAILNQLELIFTNCLISQTYSCIKKRGIHKCLRDVNKALKDKISTTYCLKIDIKKFYPSIDHAILKQKLRTKLKDKDLLYLLDEIIDSCNKGVPLGNYLSQWFANFYLNSFDHWLKEKIKIRYYFRYCDDIVILHESKEYLYCLKKEIENYLFTNLNLFLSNYQIFPVKDRGIDFVGYKSFHDYILLRKSIKERFKKMVLRNKNNKSIVSYYGWLKHADCKNLLKKYNIKI
jgi:hypothetical protein